jgi:hypothetical protein
MSNIKYLKNYVQDFVDSSPVFGTLIYGEVRRVQELVKAKAIKYPLVHLERPTIKTQTNGYGNYTLWFIGNLNVFMKYDTSGESSAMDESILNSEESIIDVLLAFQKKINHDAASGLIEIDPNPDEDLNTLEPIPINALDKHVGRQIDFKFSINVSNKLC